MSAPKRRVLSQYGYLINETGAAHWGYLDLQYDGANSTTRAQIERQARDAVNAADLVGVKVTARILRRDHLTTTWQRMIPGVVDEGGVQP